MKLSAPIFRLKRHARILSREKKIPLNNALDQIAMKEGFNNWSLLMSKISYGGPARKLHDHLQAGDMVLLGARPGHGKTLLGLELILENTLQGSHGAFFTLEYTSSDIDKLRQFMGRDRGKFLKQIQFDDSDQICSSYIIDQLAASPEEAMVVIDYLQLLDQNRNNPDLAVQLNELKVFAEKNRMILIFISQIDRSFDHSSKPFPELEDVRLPNPVDLSLFNKTCFLNNGEMRIGAGA